MSEISRDESMAFTDDCFYHLSQFAAGFLARLLLKDGPVPTGHIAVQPTGRRRKDHGSNKPFLVSRPEELMHKDR